MASDERQKGRTSNSPQVSRRGFLEATGTVTTGLAARGMAGIAGAAALACDADADYGPSSQPDRPEGSSDAAWSAVRKRFAMEPGVAYMNNASLGMPPAAVAEAAGLGYAALSRNPTLAKQELSERVAGDVVPRLAGLLGAAPDEIVLTRNASEALHTGAVGVRLSPGDEVLVTSQEHPAGRRPWDYRAARDGIKVNTVFVPSPFESGEAVVNLVEDALTPMTRVLAFCHVTRGGHLYPVRRLCAMARERGIVSFVDGAQAIGMFPVDLQELGCDAYCASLHKWLLGPMGTGVLYVRADARIRVRSAFAPGFRGSEAEGSGESSAQYRPPGTADLPVRAALAASLDLAETLGLDRIGARNRTLSDYLKVRLADMSGVTLLSGPTSETSCPGSTIFEKHGLDAVEAVTIIADKAGIYIDEHQRDGHNAIRVSTHYYNTTDEIDRLADLLANGLPTL